MQTLINKTTDQRGTEGAIWIDMIHAIWWISALWLSLASAGITYFLVRWVILKDDPLRYETAIVSVLIFFCSLPAGLGVLVAGLVPRTGLSPYKRIGVIALLLLCFGILMLHNHLQAKVR